MYVDYGKKYCVLVSNVIFYPEDGGSALLCSTGTFLPYHKASHPRHWQSSYSCAYTHDSRVGNKHKKSKIFVINAV